METTINHKSHTFGNKVILRFLISHGIYFCILYITVNKWNDWLTHRYKWPVDIEASIRFGWQFAQNNRILRYIHKNLTENVNKCEQRKESKRIPFVYTLWILMKYFLSIVKIDAIPINVKTVHCKEEMSSINLPSPQKKPGTTGKMPKEWSKKTEREREKNVIIVVVWTKCKVTYKL